MRTGRTVLTVVLAVLLAGPALAAPGDRVVPGGQGKGEYNTVTAEGRGPDKDVAVSDALRNAVERAAGQFIHSQTESKDYQVILDRILAKSAGFVKRYDIEKVSEPDANGIVTVRITADVAVQAVATEWGEIQILLQQKNKPRIMVAIGEKIDGEVQDDSIVGSEIEKQLLGNDFPLVDKAQFTEVQKRDVKEASFDNDLEKVIALGRQFGAELIVVGSAVAEYGSQEDLYGTRVTMYGATLRVRVVRTDNAAALFSDNLSARKGSRSRNGAAAEALRDAGAQMARKVQDGILAKWGREVAESQSVNLEVDNMTFSQRTAFVAALKKLKVVKGVQPRTLARKIATFTVDIKGSADMFAEALDAMAEPKVEVVEVSANVIKCKLLVAEGQTSSQSREDE